MNITHNPIFNLQKLIQSKNMKAEEEAKICRKYFPGMKWEIIQDGNDPKRPWRRYTAKFPISLGYMNVSGDNTKFAAECYWNGEFFAGSGQLETLEQSLECVKNTMTVYRDELNEILGK